MSCRLGGLELRDSLAVGSSAAVTSRGYQACHSGLLHPVIFWRAEHPLQFLTLWLAKSDRCQGLHLGWEWGQHLLAAPTTAQIVATQALIRAPVTIPAKHSVTLWFLSDYWFTNHSLKTSEWQWGTKTEVLPSCSTNLMSSLCSWTLSRPSNLHPLIPSSVQSELAGFSVINGLRCAIPGLNH